jgi:hypothetical protein
MAETLAAETCEIPERSDDPIASEASEWISTNDALSQLCAQGASSVAVKEMLADYLRDGLVRAKAGVMWISAEANLTKAWQLEPNAEFAEHDISIPVRYWRSDKRPGEDRRRWRWPYNEFFHTIRLKPLQRRMFKGVQFSTSDLAKFQPALFSSPRRKRGAPVDVTKRDAIWMEIVRLAVAGELNTTAYPHGSDLIKDLFEKMDDGRGNPRAGETQIKQVGRMVHAVLKPSPGT